MQYFKPSLALTAALFLSLGLSFQDVQAKKGKFTKADVELAENSSSRMGRGNTAEDWEVRVGGFSSDELSLEQKAAALRKAIEIDQALLQQGVPIFSAVEVQVGRWNEPSLAKQIEAIEGLLKGYQSWQEQGIDPFAAEPVKLGREQAEELSLAERIEALETTLKIKQALKELELKPGKDEEEVEVKLPWNYELEQGADLDALKFGALYNELGFFELMQALKVDLNQKIEADYSKKGLKEVLEELLPEVALSFEGVKEDVSLASFKVEGANLDKVLRNLNEGAGVFLHFKKEGITVSKQARLEKE